MNSVSGQLLREAGSETSSVCGVFNREGLCDENRSEGRGGSRMGQREKSGWASPGSPQGGSVADGGPQSSLKGPGWQSLSSTSLLGQSLEVGYPGKGVSSDGGSLQLPWMLKGHCGQQGHHPLPRRGT